MSIFENEINEHNSEQANSTVNEIFTKGSISFADTRKAPDAYLNIEVRGDTTTIKSENFSIREIIQSSTKLINELKEKKNHTEMTDEFLVAEFKRFLIQ